MTLEHFGIHVTCRRFFLASETPSRAAGLSVRLPVSRKALTREAASQAIQWRRSANGAFEKWRLGRACPLHPNFQTSTCSAIASASSTSMPRYLTVLSILVWPSNSWTARRLPVFR